MGIYFRDILIIIISKGASNCVQHVFERKYLFYNDISPHFTFLFSNEWIDFGEFLNNRSKGLTMHIYFHSLL